jgi:hypothetical protein
LFEGDFQNILTDKKEGAGVNLNAKLISKSEVLFMTTQTFRMKNILLFLSLFICCYSSAQDHKAIRQQLEEINDLDQKYRIILDSLVLE